MAPMDRRITRRAFVAGAAAMAVLAALPAWAQSLDELRRGGQVGERYDGLLAIRIANPPTGLLNTVERVNGERRAVYQKRAQEQGVPADQVGRVYAQQIVQRAPAGTWFLGENGQWRQK